MQAPAVVFDNGSATFKAGFAGEDLPRTVFPCIAGRPRHYGPEYNMKECYVGYEALSLRGIMGIKTIIEDGIVMNHENLRCVWAHAFANELGVLSESEHAVLLTEPPNNPASQRARAAEILFEGFKVPAFCMRTEAVLALLCAGRTSGMVLDSGEGVSYAVPVYEGRALKGEGRLDVAGRAVSEYLMRLLMESGYPLTTTAERESLRDIKERMCYVAMDFEEELVALQRAGEERYELPDGQTVLIGSERIRAPEALFQPSLLELELPGLHQTIYNTLNACDASLQRELYANIVLSGGTSTFRGLETRLSKELKKLAPDNVQVNILAMPERKYAAWSGGSIFASLSTFDKLCCTKAEYEEFGEGILMSNFL
ncbi:actin family [Mycena amicta]|nr:actin family [Mycena amicta]